MASDQNEARHSLRGEPNLFSYKSDAILGDADCLPADQAPQCTSMPWTVVLQELQNDPRIGERCILCARRSTQHGWVITTLGGTPVAWKSYKQPFPALSTAEAELIKVIEAVVVGNSIACLVEEMVKEVHKYLKWDNTAAVSIASSATEGIEDKTLEGEGYSS